MVCYFTLINFFTIVKYFVIVEFFFHEQNNRGSSFRSPLKYLILVQKSFFFFFSTETEVRISTLKDRYHVHFSRPGRQPVPYHLDKQDQWNVCPVNILYSFSPVNVFTCKVLLVLLSETWSLRTQVQDGSVTTTSLDEQLKRHESED